MFDMWLPELTVFAVGVVFGVLAAAVALITAADAVCIQAGER